MRRKPGGRAAIVNAPAGYEASCFAGLERAASTPAGAFDWARIFVQTEAELKQLAPKAARALKPEGILWISYPKGSSNGQTDLTRDKGWDSLKELDLRWVSLISVNDNWLAFALCPYKPGEARTQAWS